MSERRKTNAPLESKTKREKKKEYSGRTEKKNAENQKEGNQEI